MRLDPCFAVKEDLGVSRQGQLKQSFAFALINWRSRRGNLLLGSYRFSTFRFAPLLIHPAADMLVPTAPLRGDRQQTWQSKAPAPDDRAKPRSIARKPRVGRDNLTQTTR